MGCRGSKKKRSQHTAKRSVKSGVKSSAEANDYSEGEVGSEEGSETGGAAPSGAKSPANKSDVLNVRIKVSDDATSKVIGKPSSAMQQNILSQGKSSLPKFPGQMASKLQYQSEVNSKYSQFDSRFDGGSVLSQGGSSVLSSQIRPSSAGSAMGTGSNLSSSNISSAMSSGTGSSIISQSTAGSFISQGGSSLAGSKFQSSIKKGGRSKAGRSSLPRSTAGSKVGGKASKFLAEKGRVGTTPSQIFTKYLGDKKTKKTAGSKVR